MGEEVEEVEEAEEVEEVEEVKKKKKKDKKKKKKKDKKKKKKKKKAKMGGMITEDTINANIGMWDSYEYTKESVEYRDSDISLSDEEAGRSKPKKKKKKKEPSVKKIKSVNKMLDPKYRKSKKEMKNLSYHGNKIKPNHRYRIDDGRIGICKFRGRTLFGKSSEDWVGILVEYGDGVHNGTIKGKTYFRCADGRGIMVRPQRIIQDLGLSDGTILTKKMIKGSKPIRQLLQ